MTRSPDRGYLLRDMPSTPGPKTTSYSHSKQFLDERAENSFRRVSKYQTGQIVALTFAFIFSTAASLTLSYANFVLSPDCVLFAFWIGTKSDQYRTSKFSTPPSNDTLGYTPIDSPSGWLYGEYSVQKPILELNNLESKWGRKRHCYVSQYGFAAAAVASFILCWFFVFFRPTREAYFLKKKTAASKLVVPAIIFCIAFVVCVFVASITLQMGIAEWCQSVRSLLKKCSTIQDYAVTWGGKTTYVDFYPVLISGLVFAWFASIMWLANLITLSKRMYHYVDFPEYFFRPKHANVVQSETDSD